jgi:hypothetical protein
MTITATPATDLHHAYVAAINSNGTSRYRPREDGTEIGEIGKGTCIYRRALSGEWRLLIDSWSNHENA